MKTVILIYCLFLITRQVIIAIVFFLYPRKPNAFKFLIKLIDNFYIISKMFNWNYNILVYNIYINFSLKLYSRCTNIFYTDKVSLIRNFLQNLSKLSISFTSNIYVRIRNFSVIVKFLFRTACFKAVRWKLFYVKLASWNFENFQFLNYNFVQTLFVLIDWLFSTMSNLCQQSGKW